MAAVADHPIGGAAVTRRAAPVTAMDTGMAGITVAMVAMDAMDETAVSGSGAEVHARVHMVGVITINSHRTARTHQPSPRTSRTSNSPTSSHHRIRITAEVEVVSIATGITRMTVVHVGVEVLKPHHHTTATTRTVDMGALTAAHRTVALLPMEDTAAANRTIKADMGEAVVAGAVEAIRVARVARVARATTEEDTGDTVAAQAVTQAGLVAITEGLAEELHRLVARILTLEEASMDLTEEAEVGVLVGKPTHIDY